MNYIKLGLKSSVGWYLGKSIVRIIGRICDDLTRCYVPEKFWNDEDPNYILRNKDTKKDTSESKMKIGFN